MNKYLNIHLNTYVNNNTFKRLNGEVDVQNGNQPNKTMYNNPNRKKMEKTKYVAFSTQKGGAGKTTLTVLVASYLHYVKGFNVAIIDCDHPQYSISGIRSRDAEASVKDAHYKKMAYEQIKKLNKKPYPVTKSKAEDALEVAEKMKAKHPTLDFIFFDLPGTANNNDVICLVGCPVRCTNFNSLS